MASWFDWGASALTGSPIGGVLSWGTDMLGITDTGAAKRGYDAMSKGASAASSELDRNMDPVFGMYKSAMDGRDMGDVLNTYRGGMNGELNAGSSENVQQYLNPMYSRALQNTANNVMAGAGSSLQSSAANANVANAVSNASTQMWQNAFQDAMSDSKNNQGIYGNVAQSDLSPSMNWAQLQSDMASTKYQKSMDLANAAGQVAGQNQSWLGNIF